MGLKFVVVINIVNNVCYCVLCSILVRHAGYPTITRHSQVHFRTVIELFFEYIKTNPKPSVFICPQSFNAVKRCFKRPFEYLLRRTSSFLDSDWLSGDSRSVKTICKVLIGTLVTNAALYFFSSTYISVLRSRKVAVGAFTGLEASNIFNNPSAAASLSTMLYVESNDSQVLSVRGRLTPPTQQCGKQALGRHSVHFGRVYSKCRSETSQPQATTCF